MEYINRLLESPLKYHLARGKSILLLGPRQTGKSTLLTQLPSDLSLSLVAPQTRQRYERDSSILAGEVEALKQKKGRPVLVILDEIQKVPSLLDLVQDLIDRRIAQFVLTGSSARKLRRGGNVNLLPGRLVSMRLDPLIRPEYATDDLESLLSYGSLPAIALLESRHDRELDLQSYVEGYLEEEVRAEALVRNIGTFSRFLELASLESGNIISFRALSQDIGVSHTTIAAYYEVLEDCLIVERIDPITKNKTRKRLMKSSRHLIFDLGVRRLCANEGTKFSRVRLGQLFEQFVGLELIRLARLARQKTTLHFWRDLDGPEVDWVIDQSGAYIPVETKWTDSPTLRDARHLLTFLAEYPEAKRGWIVCRSPRPLQLHPKITALPWQDMATLIKL